MTGLIFFLSTEKSKTDEWKLTLKERHSSKVKGERVPPVGASADQSHDDISLRGEIIPQLFLSLLLVSKSYPDCDVLSVNCTVFNNALEFS